MAQMASTDPLTGLRNHRAFHEDLGQELRRASRGPTPLSLVMLDLDDLKSVNDQLGHQAGDERLRALATAIKATQRAGDSAFRVGGDEFAVVLRGHALLGCARIRATPCHGAGPRSARGHRHRGHLRGVDDSRQGRADPGSRSGLDRCQAHQPAGGDLQPGHARQRRYEHRRGRASHADPRQRPRARRRRQGLLYAQPLPDGRPAQRHDRHGAGHRSRAARAHPAGRPAP